MKKGFIFATTLAMALGVGVAVGAHQSKAAEVKADIVSTVYCKVSQSWWKADGAAVGAYFWKGDGEQAVAPVAWPGTRMTAVQNQTDLWSISVPADVEKVIFTRVNGGTGAVSDWGAKTSNLTIQSVKNCYTVTSESAVWGNPGVTGNWSVYPTVAPEYHLLGSVNSWKDDNDEYLFTVDGLDSNHYTLNDVLLTSGTQLKVCDVKNDDWFDNGAGNIVVADDGTYDIDFYVEVEYGDRIVLNKQAAPVQITYSVKYGSTHYEFALDDEHKPEGADHQYKATIDNPYVWRARELEFYKKVGDADPVKMTSNIGVDWDMQEDKPVAGNNIVGDATNGFKVYTSNDGMDVYMKQYDAWFSLWGTEFVENEYYLSHGKGTLALDEDFVPYGDYVKQYKTSAKVTLNRLNVAEVSENYYISDLRGGSQDLNMETAGQNNAVSKASIYFDVHNNCSEFVYLKEKADLSLWLYIGGYEEAHVVTIGEQEITLEKDGDEYVAHGVALSAGDQVTAFTIDGEASAVTSKKVANNNLGEDKKVIANVASADIYYDIDNKTLWVSGLPAAGQHLLKNGNTVIEMNHTDPYDGYDQYASGMLTFAANDTIKVVNTGVDNSYAVIWCPSIVATSTNLVGKFAYDSEKGEMKCVTACSAAVYLKIKSGVDEVYFGDVPEYIEEAVDFANGFKSAMATACSAEGKQAAVEAAWALQATAYSGLTQDAKDALYLGGYSLVEEIQEFAERYVAIYQQHGGHWDLDDFLEWHIEPNIRFDTTFGDIVGGSNTMIIVISIAAASVLAFGVALYLKKRKQK